MFTRVLVILVAGILLGYDVWEGFGNFTGIQQQRLQLGLELTAVGWIATSTLIFLPVVLYIAGIILTRRMPLGRLTLCFGLAVALSAIVNLDIVLGLPVTAIFDAGAAG